MLERWKKAVIHLECATDSLHFYDRIKKMIMLRDKMEKGEISEIDYMKELSGGTRDCRYHGTALFVSHNSRKYLLTARHVVFDETTAKREFQEEMQRSSSCPENIREGIMQSAFKNAQNKIFNIIFRVPSLNEIILSGNEGINHEFLMNLGAGTQNTVPYTFSSPDLDLAIISLDQRDSKFSEELIKMGYEPISTNEISNEPIQEGSEVFTVGFPSSTALLGQINQPSGMDHWSSKYFSLPVFTFGRVSMSHEALNFYWIDMSIYPGNSGGPVIGNGKLIGIVSAQATLPIDSMPDISTRIPFGKIIKTKDIINMIKIQEQKDRIM